MVEDDQVGPGLVGEEGRPQGVHGRHRARHVEPAATHQQVPGGAQPARRARRRRGHLHDLLDRRPDRGIGDRARREEADVELLRHADQEVRLADAPAPSIAIRYLLGDPEQPRSGHDSNSSSTSRARMRCSRAAIPAARAGRSAADGRRSAADVDLVVEEQVGSVEAQVGGAGPPGQRRDAVGEGGAQAESAVVRRFVVGGQGQLPTREPVGQLGRSHLAVDRHAVAVRDRRRPPHVVPSPPDQLEVVERRIEPHQGVEQPGQPLVGPELPDHTDTDRGGARRSGAAARARTRWPAGPRRCRRGRPSPGSSCAARSASRSEETTTRSATIPVSTATGRRCRRRNRSNSWRWSRTQRRRMTQRTSRRRGTSATRSSWLLVG